MLYLQLALFFAILVLASSIESLQEEYAKEQFKLRKEICYKQPDYGKCKGRRSLWYFNVHRHKCMKFVYSNCGGNQNRFFSSADCEEFCKGFPLPKPNPLQKRSFKKARKA
ncbi:hypothetical protein KR067_012353 [Drosophila pandora]|nr:hypothetical protein KR067_012353 [Drosophila pandora]